MAHIALIDDDPVEAMVIGGLLEHVKPDHTLHRFASVEAFAERETAEFDLLLLDRRVPPHQSFESSLEALVGSAYRGPVVLFTASAESETALRWRGGLHGPVDKGQLLTPDAVARLIARVLGTDESA
jgi:CheY-like chemotaxis protein